MKNQIWSLDTVSRAGGFHPFPVENASVGSAWKGPSPEEPITWNFDLLPATLEKLLEEPGVRARMDLLVQKRVNQALNTILDRFSWFKEGADADELQATTPKDLELEVSQLAARLDNQWKLKFQDLEQLKTRTESVLDASVSEWKMQRDSLLRNHEKEWLNTLGYLVERLQIKQKSLDLEAFSHWLSGALEEFSIKAPVTVFISTSDFQQLHLNMSSEITRSWTFQEDKTLSSGQVRVEANNAGVVFDRDQSFRKVLQMLEGE